jgi:hypothetical protein
MKQIFSTRVGVDARGWRFGRNDGPFNYGRGKLCGMLRRKPQSYLVTAPVGYGFRRSVDGTWPIGSRVRCAICSQGVAVRSKAIATSRIGISTTGMLATG